MPDSPETRIGRLERDFSALKQQVQDVAHDVETLAPVQMSVVRIEGQVERVGEQIAAVREALAEERRIARKRAEETTAELQALEKELKNARDAQAADQVASRRLIITSAVSIIVTLLTVAGTILAAGAFQ